MISTSAAVATPKPATKKRGRPRQATGKRPPILPTAIYDRPNAAAVAGCSVFTLMRAYDAGHLQGYRQGRYIKHSGQHLLDWMEAGGKTA